MKRVGRKLKVAAANGFLGCALMMGVGVLKAEGIAAPRQTRGEATPNRVPALAEAPFKLYRDYAIVVRGSIEGCDKLNLFVDTGSSSTVIDASLARKLQLPSSLRRIEVFANAITTEEVVLPAFQMGPVRVASVSAVVQDLSGLQDTLSVRVDVIVGIDVLSRSSFAVDYKAKKLILGPVEPLSNTVKCDPHSPYPTVPLEVGGRIVRVYVDTGAQELAIFQSHVGGLVQGKQTTGAENRTSMAGQVVVKPAEFQDVSLGANHWAVRKGLLLEAPSTLFDGVLGPKWLGASRIAFDVEHRLVSWER